MSDIRHKFVLYFVWISSLFCSIKCPHHSASDSRHLCHICPVSATMMSNFCANFATILLNYVSEFCHFSVRFYYIGHYLSESRHLISLPNSSLFCFIFVRYSATILFYILSEFCHYFVQLHTFFFFLFLFFIRIMFIRITRLKFRKK